MPPNEYREQYECRDAGGIENLLVSELINWSEQFTINFVGLASLAFNARSRSVIISSFGAQLLAEATEMSQPGDD